jgi:hypothetical protein
MLTTQRHDQRTRRQARFELECLDDRLVLSAGGGGMAVAQLTAVEHRLEGRLAQLQARHGAQPTAAEARIQSRIARIQARIASPAMAAAAVAVNVTAPATANAASRSAPSAPATINSPGLDPNHSLAGPGLPFVTSPGGTNSGGLGNPTDTGSGGTGSGGTGTNSGSLPANVGGALQSLFQEFESASGNFTPSQPSDNLLQISGDNVGVNIKVDSSSDFNTVLSRLQADGMQVSASSATFGIITGMAPISNLPSIAQVASSVTAAPPPFTR